MEFRPCIDIHNGMVKQIVGSTLRDAGDKATENFVSDHDAAYFAGLYKSYGLFGGHVIMLNAYDSPYYEATRAQAVAALKAYPGGLMAGGGINADNASYFIDAGASHVIVTSYVFSDGAINMDNLQKLVGAVGREHIVLDLSCIKRGDAYFVATNRWQTVTDEEVNEELFAHLSGYCDEFLVHAVDSEGKSSGPDERLIGILGNANVSVCYAGGISSYDDIIKIKDIGKGKVDFTVGSRLDVFGGDLSIEEITECIR